MRLVRTLFLLAVCVPAPVAAQAPLPVTGTVLADDTGAPVAGALVLIAGQPRDTSSGADGRFRFAGLAPGTYMLVVSRDGFAALSQEITVTAGGATIEVRLPRQVTVAETLTVVGRLSDYVDTSAGAARTSASLIDVPQAIVVLPARLIEDIGALDTKDLYKFMSGVSDSPYSSTVMRGFTQREVLVNGVKGNPYGSFDGDVNNSGFSTSQFRLTNLERVEVLKGPSSVLYGAGEPGGVINYVTRKPQDVFAVRASFGTGQFGQALGEAEVTGPANAARTLLYRAAAYYEDRDSFRSNAGMRNVHAVGALTYRPNSRTALAMEVERIDQQNTAHRLRGVPVTAAGDFLADYRWTATEPTDFTNLAATVAQVRIDRVLGAAARADATFRYLSYDREENYHEPRGITAGNVMQREFRDQFRTNDDWTFAVGVTAPVRTGGVRHDVAAGVDMVSQDFLFRAATARQASSGGPVPPLALVSPVYGAVNTAAYGLTPANYATDLAETRRTGLYVQDLMALGPRVNLLLGGRVDRYEDTGTSGGRALAGDQTAVTGRAGVVVKPRPNVSVYASTANGFSRAPVLSQTPSANGPHDAETARQVEVGVKTDWLDGRAQLTTAYFHIVKQNVLRPDPSFGPTGANFNALLATGEIRNRGLEIDLAGSPLPHWNLAFNYAWLDSAIARDTNAAVVGKPMPNAAPHAVGLFTRIDLPAGAAVGGSLEYTGDRQEPFAGIRAPAYTVVDLHYFQQLGPRLKVLARLDNVFDQRYAASSLFAARAGNFPGQPRTFSVQLTVSTTRPRP
jgi:iron complex outermembrane recepter protein